MHKKRAFTFSSYKKEIFSYLLIDSVLLWDIFNSLRYYLHVNVKVNCPGYFYLEESIIKKPEKIVMKKNFEIHADRVVGCHRDYCDFGSHAASRPVQGA
jgi:hypothetical protein